MSDPVFVTATTNPFSLADVGSFSNPIFVDIDGDGDLDAFVGERLGNTLFFENTSATITPSFAVATNNPFSLADVGSYSSPTFVDIDGDGDLDAFVGNNAGNTLFFKNIGSPTNPLFAVATNNPFNIANVGNYSSPTLVDIDGDGDLDAFVGNNAGNTLFFKNIGSPTNPLFAVATNNPFSLADVGSYSSPTFVDIDGDGDLDAFIGERFGNTLFFRNTGSPTNPLFTAVTNNPFGLADVGYASSPTFVDIDRDGDLDAFTGNSYGNTLFFRNNKPPEITTARYDLNTGSLVVMGTGFLVATGINNDIDVSKLTITGQGGSTYTLTSSNVDITSATNFTITLNAADKAVISKIVNKKGEQSSSGTTYNLAAAAGWAVGAPIPAIVTDLTGNRISAVADPILFGNYTNNPFGLNNVGAYAAPTFIDIDGDGDLDAFVGNNAGNTLFFKNTGTINTPAFAAASTDPFGLADVGASSKPAFVDIDGDGDLDAFVGSNTGDIVFFKNTGTTTDPAFATAVVNYNGLTDVGTSATPAFADIDGDGDLDAFIGNNSGNTLFFKNTGTTNNPSFASAIANPFGLENTGSLSFTLSSPTVMDIDGDGKLDFLSGAYFSYNAFHRNTGTTTAPSFATATDIPVLSVGYHGIPKFVDIDGDGNLDAFVGNQDGNIRFYRNALRSIRTDFNGDRKSDILWRKNDGTVALWQMNGSTVTTGSYVTPTLDSTWKIASTADFSGDGKADILWRNDNGTNALWTMNGSAIVGGGYLPTLDSTWKVASTADFDGDKKADLLWRKDDGTTALWKMDGATVVSGGYLPTLDSTWKVASSGDFDGDAKADLLWRKDDGTTALWKMDGSAVVSGSYLPTLDSTWKVASSADFNGDGKTDLLWRKNDGTTALWTMNGAAVVAGGYLPTLDNTWKVASSGDFNGDGKADILWRNDNGTNALWEMNGATVLAGSYTPTLDSSWQVAAPIL
jgi:large repetitive protein